MAYLWNRKWSTGMSIVCICEGGTPGKLPLRRENGVKIMKILLHEFSKGAWELSEQEYQDECTDIFWRGGWHF